MSVDHLRASYDRRVITDASFTAAPGATTVIMGTPGSGKTTLVRILLGRLGAESGEVTVGGRSVLGASPGQVADIHGHTGFLFSGVSAGSVGRKGSQRGVAADPDDGVNPTASVGGNVRAALGSAPTDDGRVGQWLETFGLVDDETRRAGELDAGARRRLALARVFVAGPTLVVLDDPVGGLDPESRDAVVAALRGAREASNATIILTCYDVIAAKALGDHLVALSAGRTRVQGPAGRLLRLITSDQEWASQFALGGKPIDDTSTESLDEHKLLRGLYGINQQVLVFLVAIIGIVALVAIVVYMVAPKLGM